MNKINNKSFMLGCVEMESITEAFHRMFLNPNIKTTYIFIGNLDPKYIKESVKITRKRMRGCATTDFVMTIGKLNYREREYMKLCKKAGGQPRRWWAIPMPGTGIIDE